MKRTFDPVFTIIHYGHEVGSSGGGNIYTGTDGQYTDGVHVYTFMTEDDGVDQDGWYYLDSNDNPVFGYPQGGEPAQWDPWP